MAIVQISRIQVRRGRETQTGIPQLSPGEFGWAEDTEHLYIGKRIVEGAPNDSNTRVLTEVDLNAFKLLALNTGTVSASYQYRSDISNYLTHTTTTTVKNKLDNLDPSLTDFGLVIQPNTSTDITAILQNAIGDLYANQLVSWDSDQQRDFRRTLIIPAGDFVIGSAIELPPRTTIRGQGPGITNITFTNSTTNMFSTVDADGNLFESGNMNSGAKRARDIQISGLTLELDNNLISAKALISIDNVSNVKISDCVFRTKVASTTTTTYGLVDHGVGIELRGTGQPSVELCENILIEDCRFDSLQIAVRGTGTVSRPVIYNSVFSNLQQGIVMGPGSSISGPTNGVFENNRFTDIVGEGIYVGENPNMARSNHLSENNFFARVGNGVLSDYTESTATSVIKFLASGNKSVNDVFKRREIANTTTNTLFYYNPLVIGSTTISDSSTFSYTLPPVTVKNVVKIPLNGGDQMATMNYQISCPGLSRKGNLLINISPAGYVTMTDYYNYTNYLRSVQTGIVPLAGSGLDVLKVSAASYPFFGTVTPESGTWFLSGSNTYLEKAAAILNITLSAGVYTIQTQSSSPTFNFATAGETYLLLKEEDTGFDFYYTRNLNKNYVTITCTNNSDNISATLDYQIDIET